MSIKIHRAYAGEMRFPRQGIDKDWRNHYKSSPSVHGYDCGLFPSGKTCRVAGFSMKLDAHPGKRDKMQRLQRSAIFNL
jgi:hypothetical protein